MIKSYFAVMFVWMMVPGPVVAHTPVGPNATIRSSGEYVLTSDSTSTGEFNIRIEADNVALDLNGKTVRCNPPDPGTARTFGIFFESRNNVRIYNGTITGCFMGVNAREAKNTVLEDIDFTRNTYIGAQMGGSGTRVTNCVFADIVGFNQESYSIGLNGPGSDSIVENNHFRNLHRQPGAHADKVGEGVGVIITAGTRNASVRGNWFEQDKSVTGDIGIWIATESTGVIVEENALTGFHGSILAAGSATATVRNNRLWLRHPLPGSRGIHGNEGIAIGNLIVGFENPISGKIEKVENTDF